MSRFATSITSFKAAAMKAAWKNCGGGRQIRRVRHRFLQLEEENETTTMAMTITFEYESDVGDRWY